MKLVKPFACIIAAAALVAPNAHAGVIAEYTFAGGSAASSDVDGTTTATDVTFGSWLSEDGDGNSPGISAGSETAFGRTEDTGGSSPQNTLADAIASEDYFSFTITGAGFDVKQINYDYFVTAAAAGVVSRVMC